MTDHGFFAAMAVDIPSIAPPTRIDRDLAAGDYTNAVAAVGTDATPTDPLPCALPL